MRSVVTGPLPEQITDVLACIIGDLAAVLDAVNRGPVNVVQVGCVPECDRCMVRLAHCVKLNGEVAALLLLCVVPLDALLVVNIHDLLRHACVPKVPVLLWQLEDQVCVTTLCGMVHIRDLRFENGPHTIITCRLQVSVIVCLGNEVERGCTRPDMVIDQGRAVSRAAGCRTPVTVV